MRRARQRLLRAFSAGLAVALWPLGAAAFHSGSVFDKPPGAGGGGGIFYTGAPLEHGWDCNLCHLDAPGKLQVRMKVDPPELFETFKYVPGQTYTFTATLQGESLGLSSPLSNYNGVAFSITDEQGFSVGSIGGFVPEDFYSANPTTIASAGQKVGQTQWTFAYTAPDTPAGTLYLRLAAVDGNGANSQATETLTDPFGDDVFVGTITLEQGALAAAPPSDWDGAIPALAALATALVTVRRPRRRARAAAAR